MKQMKILTAAAIVSAIAFASTQMGAQDNTAREARDRAEIEALMWRYARALDTSNAEAYASAYAPDGQFRPPLVPGHTNRSSPLALKITS